MSSSEIVLATVGVVVILVVSLSLFLFLGVSSGRIMLSNSSNVENLPSPDARSLLSNVLLATSAILGSVFAVAFGFSQFVISRIFKPELYAIGLKQIYGPRASSS